MCLYQYQKNKKNKTHAGWIKSGGQATDRPVPNELNEMSGRGKKKKPVVIQCPRKTKQTVHFIQGGRHVVVYIRTARCVNLNMGLPCRHALVPPTTKSPRPQGSTFQAWTPPAPEANASKPRHLCQSHHHAGRTHSSSLRTSSEVL